MSATSAAFASGALYVDVEIATELLGFSAPALLWITVPPSELTAAAERIAAARESAFVAAVSGPANLHATVACRDPHHLHEFLVREVGALKAVHMVETSLMARRVKQAGSIMRGPRLPEPGQGARWPGLRCRATALNVSSQPWARVAMPG